MPSCKLTISFPGIGPRQAGQIVQDLQAELEADPIEGLTTEPSKPDADTMDLGTALLAMGEFAVGVSEHAVGHAVGVTLMAGLGFLLARVGRKAAKEGVTPSVTVEAPPEVAKQVDELKTKHGLN